MEGENIAPRVELLLPSLPSIDMFDDSNVNLWPVAQPSIMDLTIPKIMNLPPPIEPIQRKQKTKRLVPNLMPIRNLIDFNSSSYGKNDENESAKPSSNGSGTSKLILELLDNYEKHDVPNGSISLSPGFGLNESDEQFGKLVYSDDSV